MRALQLVDAGVLAVGDVPIPTIGPDEVLVRVAGAGLCHSDVVVRHVPSWRRYGMIMGHETAGYVDSLGAEVVGLREGDAVLVCLVWACGTCHACRQGRDNACRSGVGRLGLPPCPGLGPDGGMAEYMTVKARYLEPLGSLDPTTAAPLADAALTPMHAINGARHRLTPGSTVVAIGVGGLGHLGVQLLRATADVRILAVDVDEAKLELARRHDVEGAFVSGLGTAAAILEQTDGYGADAVFDFVGVQDSVDLATQVIAPDGALRFVGLGGGGFRYSADSMPVPLPWGADVRRSYGGTRADQRQVIELAQAGRIVVETTKYDLEDAVAAFDDLEAGRVSGRAVLIP